MSNLRAAMRREKENRRKVEKRKSNDVELLRMRGIDKGRVLAGSTMINILYDEFNFRKNKLNEFIGYISKEAPRSEQQGVMFVMNFYSDKIIKKINSKIPVYKMKPEEYAEYVSIVEYYVSCCSLMCVVLNEKYHFASNNKGTGRIDRIIDLIVSEFVKLKNDGTFNDTDSYFKNCVEKTECCLW